MLYYPDLKRKVQLTKARKKPAAKSRQVRRRKLSDLQAPFIQADFDKGFRLFRDRVQQEDLAKAISGGDTKKIDQVIPWERLDDDLSSIKGTAQDAMAKGAAQEQKWIPEVVKPAFRFDIANPRISEWINDNTGKNITNMSKESREGILELVRDVVADVKDRGVPPGSAAKSLVNDIGLNQPQAKALDNFKKKLRKDGLSQSKIDELVDKRRNKMFKQRAKMVARTESYNAVNASELEVYNQMGDQDLIDTEKTTKTWIPAPDAWPDHEAMRGATVPLNEPWITTNGNAVMVPSLDRPNCRCVMEINPALK